MPVAAHLSLQERVALGKEARKRAPRSSHADWAPRADRQAPVDTLSAQETGRLPELLPVRHARMLASPFAFYRGAAVMMAADLDGTPDSGARTQVCGDAHLSNFGGFASPDRALPEFAERYADQNECDHAALAEAAETGRIAVEAGV
jgi:hypothetical protein